MRQLILVFLISISFQGFAQSSKHQNLENGKSIQDYDPLAYFSSKALKGNKQTSSSYKEAIYYFSSDANRQKF